MAQSPLTRNLRVIFTINDISSEVQKPSSTLKILLCENIGTVQLPCTNPVSFDFPKIQIGSKMEFYLEDAQGNVYGYSELQVPEPVFHNKEIQMNQEIPFYLNNSKKEFITAKVFLTFLNTEVQQNATQTNHLSKLSNKLSLITSKNSAQYMSAPQRKASSSPQRDSKVSDRSVQAEKSVQAFVDGLFQQYAQQIGNISKRLGDSNEKISQSKIKSPSLSSRSSLNNLHNLTPTQLLTPKDPISKRDPYSNVNSTVDIAHPISVNSKDNETMKPGNKIRTSSQKPVQVGGQKTANSDLRNHLSSVYKGRSNSTSGKQKIFNLSIDQKAINSSQVSKEKEAEQINTYATFCPNSLNMSSRDKSAEVENSISSEKLTNKLKEKTKDPKIKPTKIIDSRSNNSSTEKYNSAPRSSSISHVNIPKIHVEQRNSTKAQDSQLSVIESLKKENENLKSIIKEFKEKPIQVSDLSASSELEKKVVELEKLVELKSNQLTLAEDKNLKLAVELKTMKQQFERVQTLFGSGEQRREDERKKFAEAILSTQKALEETKNIILRLNGEKKRTNEQLQKIQIDLNYEKEMNSKLKDELLIAEKSLCVSEKYRLVIESLEAENQDLVEMLSDKKEENELKDLLEISKVDLPKSLESNGANEEDHISIINSLKQELRSSEKKVSRLTVQITSLRLKISELISEGYLNKSVEERLASSPKLKVEQTQEVARIKLFQAERNVNELKNSASAKDKKSIGKSALP